MNAEIFFGFIGQKHVWLTVVVAFLLAFGFTNPEGIERWGEIVAGWIATARCN